MGKGQSKPNPTQADREKTKPVQPTSTTNQGEAANKTTTNSSSQDNTKDFLSLIHI